MIKWKTNNTENVQTCNAKKKQNRYMIAHFPIVVRIFVLLAPCLAWADCNVEVKWHAVTKCYKHIKMYARYALQL